MGYIFHKEPEIYINSINDESFENIALTLFRYQYDNCVIYHQFVNALNVNVGRVSSLSAIPFLPVGFFKTHEVISGVVQKDALVFQSSATTSDVTAKHYVNDKELYLQSLLNGFTSFYGHPEDYVILALLPSYLQRQGASLVHMVQQLMDRSGQPQNGFYLDEHQQLHEIISELERIGQKTLLIGVTFALLDFAEQYPMKLNSTMVMETGGMKGRRKELIRSEVHNFIQERLGVEHVHSEYGMTELLSQAYAREKGLFYPANSMKVLVRDISDPLEVKKEGSGCLNIIDLANVHSCSFIATDDIGKVYDNGSFEVLGRVDNSALRGCNLMVL